FAHRGGDADFRGDAADDELLDAAALEDGVEIRRIESAFARLVDDRLARRGLELIDNVVPMLSAHEDAAHRARIADAGREPAPRLLARRQVGEIGAMALTGVDDQNARRPGGRQNANCRGYRLAQQGHVVAQRLAEPPRIDEVPLHVDDHERDGRWLKLELIGFGANSGHGLLTRFLRSPDSGASWRDR